MIELIEQNFDNNNENCIEFLSGERFTTVSFSNRKHINRIKKIYEERKDEFNLPNNSEYMTEKEQEIVYSRKYEELLGSNDDELINIWKYNQKEMLSNVSNNKQLYLINKIVCSVCEDVLRLRENTYIDDNYI